MSFNHATWPVGRKDYRCEWCGQNIPKGEKHYHYVGIWEGDFQNWRMHVECQDDCQRNGGAQDGFTPYEAERPAKLVPVAEPSHTILRMDHTCSPRT
jgi:hypothetical protein